MLNKCLKASLAKQFSILTITIILAFSLLITIFMIYQKQIINSYVNRSEKIERKENLASDLDYSFNLAISEMRAYYAYKGELSYFKKVEDQREIVEENLAALQIVAENEEDELFLQLTEEFYEYYFNDVMPRSKEFFDAGQLDEVTKIAVTQNASRTIRAYQTGLKKYTDSLNQQLTDLLDVHNKKIIYSQAELAAVLFLLIVLMASITRRMLSKIGEPLKNLTTAAGEIAEGKTVLFSDTTNRQDELGLLSKAFEKMSKSIQEKEMNLSLQNEELLAQQETLQSQQSKLESALEKMQIREIDLKRRNDLINGIANTLDKKEVLNSVVKTMSSVIDADKGIIVLLEKGRDFSSFGVSEQGIEQFINYLDSSFIVKLKETKEPYTIKRTSHPAEKGYHISNSYSYDLFLPVLTASGNIEAVMMFTRVSKPFGDTELSEYNNLSKQIAISLDKIKLFEQSERERILTQNILDTIKEGIQLVDITGSIIQINQKMCEMMGYRSSELIQKKYDDWIEELIKSVENGAEVKDFFDVNLFSEKSNTTSIVFLQHSPKQRVVQAYCERLTRDGEKAGTVIVHRDITKEYEVDVMKSEFVSIVSHELRTPLASILGFTELMLNKELKLDRQKRYLTTIYQEANRLTSLINEFLDVQRMEAGKQTYDKRYIDITPLLRHLIETYEINNPNYKLYFETKTNNTIIFGDRDKLTQVFNNLISNAIKYSPDGGNIYITIFEEDSNLKISIKDEGLGIPKDALDKLFTKFYRVDNSDRRKIGGTGLGLSIVKEIVKAHDGDISVISALKEGSIFTVSFPLVKNLTISPEETLAGRKDSEKGKVNVIIVEDDISLSNLLRTELEGNNFHVQAFTSGESALSAVKVGYPDVIILDIMLDEKGMTGWDFIKKVKEIDDLKSIPIIISSALDEKERGITSGANGYLIKPYRPSELSKLIFQTLLQKEREGQILIPSEDDLTKPL